MSNDPDHGLGHSRREALGEALGHVLADTYRVTLWTLAGQWNVSGPGGLALRALFAEQRLELLLALDRIAERLRMLGQPALPPGMLEPWPGSLPRPDRKEPSAAAFAMALGEGHALLVELLRASVDVARAYDDEASVSLLGQRLLAHERHLWLLRSSAAPG